MRYHSFLSVLALAKEVAAVPCNAQCSPGDTCVGALLALQNPGKSDCSAYLGLAIAPITVETDVTTTTTTAFVQATSIFDKRSEEIPEYATACSGVARYVSACACLGVTAVSTTTGQALSTETLSQTAEASTNLATQPTKTITQTSSIVVPSATQTPVTVLALYSGAQSGNPNIYGYLTSQFMAWAIDFTSDATLTSPFVLTSDGSLMSTKGLTNQQFAYIAPGNQQYSGMMITGSSTATMFGYTKLHCHADSGMNLVCDFNGQPGVWWLCGGHLNLAQQGYDYTNQCNFGGQSSQIGIKIAVQNST